MIVIKNKKNMAIRDKHPQQFRVAYSHPFQYNIKWFLVRRKPSFIPITPRIVMYKESK